MLKTTALAAALLLSVSGFAMAQSGTTSTTKDNATGSSTTTTNNPGSGSSTSTTNPQNGTTTTTTKCDNGRTPANAGNNDRAASGSSDSMAKNDCK